MESLENEILSIKYIISKGQIRVAINKIISLVKREKKKLKRTTFNTACILSAQIQNFSQKEVLGISSDQARAKVLKAMLDFLDLVQDELENKKEKLNSISEIGTNDYKDSGEIYLNYFNRNDYEKLFKQRFIFTLLVLLIIVFVFSITIGIVVLIIASSGLAIISNFNNDLVDALEEHIS